VVRLISPGNGVPGSYSLSDIWLSPPDWLTAISPEAGITNPRAAQLNRVLQDVPGRLEHQPFRLN
jgi:hypothetical protein